MDRYMRCSVLMAVYKQDNPEFLKLALKSVYDTQTRKPDEIVVVFDGILTDELYTVLHDFKDGKEETVCYYQQNTNCVLGEALRIGSHKCTGDYIFRMDSDDISDAHRFEKQLAYINIHPEIDVLGTNIIEFNNTILDKKKRTRICPAKHEDIIKMMKRRNPMNHVTVCIRRTALMQSGGYESLLLSEDYFLWLKMITSGYRFGNMSESLVYVRAGNDFAWRRGTKARINGWKMLQKYMLAHKMINHIEAAINMVNIIGFTYCPNFIRKFAYDNLLRKQL